jgi:hypothetical protein
MADVRDTRQRLLNLELQVGSLVATESNHYTSIMLRFDSIERRVDRIEWRLDLVELPT